MKLIAIILSLLLPGTKADHCSATPWDRDDELTESQTPGPYYIKDFNFKGNRFVPAEREDGEERLVVSGHVLDNNCHHIPCVEIEVWGTDPVGGYSFYEPYWGRGRIQTDEEGFFQFETWWPTYYPEGIFPVPIPHHLHFVVTAMGQKESFVTQMYFDFDPRADGSPPDPRVDAYPSALKVSRVQSANGVDWESCFDIVLEDTTLDESSLVVPEEGCPAVTEFSRSTSVPTMTEDEKTEAHALQGSLIGVGDNVTVGDGYAFSENTCAFDDAEDKDDQPTPAPTSNSGCKVVTSIVASAIAIICTTMFV